jgi:hypothetical protein
MTDIPPDQAKTWGRDGPRKQLSGIRVAVADWPPPFYLLMVALGTAAAAVTSPPGLVGYGQASSRRSPVAALRLWHGSAENLTGLRRKPGSLGSASWNVEAGSRTALHGRLLPRSVPRPLDPAVGPKCPWLAVEGN